jgi:hypothetical protein
MGVGLSIEMRKRGISTLPGEASHTPPASSNEAFELSHENSGGEKGV